MPDSTTTPPFGVRLRAAMEHAGPLCAGIDPHAGLLAEWGLSDDVAGLETLRLRCVEAFAGAVACVKPQSAFYERYGAAGVAVLERVARRAPEAGTLTLLDVKRGDIGSTMDAYAQAYLGEDSPLARGRDHREPVPRVRVPAARARPGRAHRPRGVRAGVDLQPGGAGGPARPDRRDVG